MKPNAIKNDIRDGKTVAGAMIFEFFSPGMASILTNAGCRFVLYDMEHTGLGFETLKWLFAACREASTPGWRARSISGPAA